MFKTIKDFPNYKVNILGQVVNKTTGKYINIRKAKIGYYTCNLWKNNSYKTKYIHRLIAIYFIHNPKKLREVNHIDGNKLNNSIYNLEWTNRKGNAIHAINTGLTPLGKKRKNCKLTDSDIRKIRSIKNKTNSYIAKLFNCSQCHVSEIKNKKARQYVK